jgi:hypothetical protein
MFKKAFIAILITLLIISCTTTVTTVSDLGLKDNKYDTDYPQVEREISLDGMINSVKMINSLVYYESHLFNENTNLKLGDLPLINLESLAVKKITSNETASGTATIIYSDKGKVALLTCAHILDFPDTIITYFKDSFGVNSKNIESVSIKIRQTNLLPEYTVSNEVEILLLDSESDIAIVGKEISAINSSKYIPTRIKIGNTNELTWGTKVYIIGYPLNNKMITNGLVSPPQVIGKDYFFVDAVFNRGFSGGIVLAIRDGAPNFELVGMVKSGSVHRNYILRPNTNDPDFIYLPNLPYSQEVIVEEETDIKYGVTKIMTVETIIDFIDSNRNKLEDFGYKLDNLFKKDVQN